MSFAQPFHDYEILDRVGAGAMGTVFKARHKKLGRIVALKVLRPSLARDTRFVDRLRREARIVAALNHPHIVTGYDLGEEGGYHYFVMEFVEGKALSALLSEWGIFAEDQVLAVATQVAAALDHAFQRNVIHRDVKPGNILIDEAGNVKLTDMGLAKGPADLTLTRDGATVGTPQYISPEQARNPQDVDVRSDLWSLGATMYHMATGQPPFKGDSMAEVIHQVLHEVPIAPRVINPAVSDGLALVIRKLLAKNVRLRYQTPRELLEDLDRVRRAEAPAVDASRLSAGEADRPHSVWKWSLATIGAAGLLLAAVWLGMTLRSPAPAAGGSDGWLASLQQELEAMPNAGQRLLRLRLAAVESPPGTAAAIEQMQRQVVVHLQQTIDRLTADLRDRAWTDVVAFSADAQRWPTAADIVRERVDRPLLAAAGLLREQLPAAVDTAGLDGIGAAIVETTRARDVALLEQAQQWVELVLPARADERLRQGDFAQAERIWQQPLAAFFDGPGRPALDRLAPGQLAPLQQRLVQVRARGMELIEAHEQRLGTAVRREVHEGVAALRRQLSPTADLRALQAAVLALREQVQRVYPPSARFRAAADPWPEVAVELAGLERELAAARRQAEHRAAEQLADLAWRAFCDGDAAAGLGVLGDGVGDPAEDAAWLTAHRAALQQAATATAALLAGLRSAPPPIPGYPRGGGLPVELRVFDHRLQAQTAGSSWRSALVTEFRLADLWQRALAAAPEEFARVPADELLRGRLVLAMVADDVEQVGSDLAAAPQPFLRTEVWPRVLAVRGEQRGQAVDRALAFGRLRQALERAAGRPDTRELELALAAWSMGFAAEASAAEQAVAGAASAAIERERQRQRRLQELRQLVPGEASIDVNWDGNRLCAAVALPPAALRGAGEGWQLLRDRLDYVCAAPVWTDVDRRRLIVSSGLGAEALRSSVALDFVVPPPERGPRLWVVAFRGACAVVQATADDRVRAAIVDGGVPRLEPVQAAIRRLVQQAADARAKGTLVLPGAVHRLVLGVELAPSRQLATVRVAIDDEELCADQTAVAEGAVPSLVILPLMDLAVTQVRFFAVDG